MGKLQVVKLGQWARVDDKSNRSRSAHAEGICGSFQHSRITPTNGVLARLSGFALGYPLASLGPRKLGGYGGNFLQMKTTQRKGDRKAVEESRAKRNGSGASFANHRR